MGRTTHDPGRLCERSGPGVASYFFPAAFIAARHCVSRTNALPLGWLPCSPGLQLEYMLSERHGIANKAIRIPPMATVLTLVSGDITVTEDMNVVQARVERRDPGLMSLTDAADGSRVLISPAHVEKLRACPEPASPPTPFPLWGRHIEPSSDPVDGPPERSPIRSV